MTQSQLLPLKFKSKRILCIGDVMVDRYVYGDVTRISPEAPVPVLTHTEQSNMLGGAGNAARNLSAMGAEVEFITVIGNDLVGNSASFLIENEIDNGRFTANIITEGGRITPLKTRYCSGSQQMLRVDHEDAKHISSATERQIIRHLSSSIIAADAVLVSDYDKGMLTPEIMDTIKSNCVFYNRPLIIDPKKRDWSLYAGATLVTPNQSEWDSFHLHPMTIYPTALLITKGKNGMQLHHNTGGAQFLSIAKNVYDVSGAGDTVAAIMTLMLACNASFEVAAWTANVAASIAVGKRGTTPVTYDELINAVHQES
jgi:D-beta-D-heptose 7-phosphate kinase/D-beta-D-heptose 1-phosphate adenosyltransferase